MIVNLLELERGEQEDRDGFRFFDRGVAHTLGAELLGCSIYDLPPKQQLWPYHFHRGNEEWAVVVTGA
ncbi:MAG: cupin, partial [Actinobacteria bacterium]|nr:cupin [Actinomycetota bacterium]